ncbi:MAG: aminotransferase class V-fold PLP-dependent enzyme, partial [Planctomycetota bacterium]
MPDPEGMILFPSSTAALSTAIAALGTRAGDGPVRLLLGPMEHNAVWRPAVRLAGREGIAHLPADPLGRVDLGALEGFPSEGFAGVVLQHASNVNGMVQPIAEVAAWCAARGLPFIVDGAQAGGLIPVALDRIPGLVAYTCAGHKYLGGPPGVGVAWLAPGFDPEPLWIGGNGVESERPSVPASGPARYECGTQNLPGIAGLEAALHRFDEEPPALRWSRLRMVRAAWRERLAEIRGVELVGEGGESPRTPVISLGIAGREPAEIAAHLEGRLGARCRAGLHCAPLAH